MSLRAIGIGAQGQVVLHTTSKFWGLKKSKIVLKIPYDKFGIKELKHERKILEYINKTIPFPCNKYFPKLVKVPEKYKKIKGILAMEYINGKTLYHYIIEHRENPKRLEKVMKRVKKAIVCLWKHGIIHGDAHLDNIMVTKNNKVKIIDFGQAKRVKPYTKNDSMEQYKKWFYPKWKAWLKQHRFPLGNPNVALLGNKSLPTYAQNTLVFVNHALQSHLKKRNIE